MDLSSTYTMSETVIRSSVSSECVMSSPAPKRRRDVYSPVIYDCCNITSMKAVNEFASTPIVSDEVC